MSVSVKVRLAAAAVAASAASLSALTPSLASAATGQSGAISAAKVAANPVGAPTYVSPDQSVVVGTTVTLTASGGTVVPPAGLSYKFSNGQVVSAALSSIPVSTTFTYANPGTYQVWVATYDGTTMSAKITRTIVVTPLPTTVPKAVLAANPPSGGASATQPLTVTLDASKSVLSTGANSLTFSNFNCGAGGPAAQPVLNVPSKATCTYTAPGNFTASVTVGDNLNRGTSIGQTNVTVTVPNPPVAPNLASFSAAPGAAPFTATASMSGVTVDKTAVKANVTYVIAWGDGQQSSYTGATKPSTPIVHTYASPATYNIVLTVNDGLNLTTSNQSVTRPVAVVSAPAGPKPVNRFAGTDRYDTGVKLSKARWAAATDATPNVAHPTAVVLATGGNFPDALAGVPLSAKLNAGLLLTDSNVLTPEVAAEIQRILPADKSHTVYILGGLKAVSQPVQDALTKLGYNVQRYAGTDRFDTALKIAAAMGDPAHVVVARADDPADALAAGPFAAHIVATDTNGVYQPAAIILSDGPQLTGASKAYVQSKLALGGITVVAVGGQATQAIAALPGIVTQGASQNIAAIQGSDRFQTAAMVAGYFPNFAPIGVATGLNFADALTGGAYMAGVNGPLLLTDAALPGSTSQAVAAIAGTTPSVNVFGGEKAVTKTVFDGLVAAVHGVAKLF